MSEDFDPYYKWLAIPSTEQPPNFYRLLSLPLYETDQEVIGAAAVQRLNWVRKFETGANSAIAKRVNDEISAAWLRLRNPQQKQQYDEQLKRHAAAEQIVPPTLFAAVGANSAAVPELARSGKAVADENPHSLGNAGDFVSAGSETKRPKRKQSSSAFGILLQASAGPIGLALGYIILCQFGPQYDFLGVWSRSDQPGAPAAVASTATNKPGWPLRKAAPKPPAQTSKQSTTNTDPKPAPVPTNASSAAKLQADSGAIEIVTQSPAVEPNTPAQSRAGDEPEKLDSKPSLSDVELASKDAPGKIQIASIGELQQAIKKARRANEVVQLISVTIADPSTAEDARSYAKSQLPTWEDRAANDAVRWGENWIPRSDAVGKRENGNELVVQAAALLSLDNEQPALARLRQARNTDPEATSAVFLLGAHYALGQRNYQAAREYFADCLRRRPDDVGALNDLGLASLMLGKHSEGLKSFRAAVAINPRSAEVVHNVRRILKQEGLNMLSLPPAVKRGYVDLLDTAINDETVTALDKFGWLYMLPVPAAAAGGLPPEVPNVLQRFEQIKTEKTVKIHSQWIEDCQCLWCRGTGKLPCTNPDCNQGKVIVKTGQELVGKDPMTKKNVYRDTFGPTNCPTCKGNGYLSCEKCFGLAIDPTLLGN